MTNIQIIADSTCDLDPTLIDGETLEILPLTITVGDKSYLDGEDMGVEAVYDLMRSGIVPKTAQIPYDRTFNLFKSLLEAGKDIIYIAFSSEMSGCFQLASMVAGELRGDYPERKMAVLDSKGGSGATGLIVLQALKLARSDFSFEALVSEIAFMAEHVEHVFSVNDMEWLSKGGRIPTIVGYIGNKLGLRPLLQVEHGRMGVLRMIRGHLKAIHAVAAEIIKRAESFPSQLISITHADDIVSAKMLEELILKGLPKCRTTLCHIGGVVGVHIGLRGVGAFCLNQKPPHYALT